MNNQLTLNNWSVKREPELFTELNSFSISTKQQISFTLKTFPVCRWKLFTIKAKTSKNLWIYFNSALTFHHYQTLKNPPVNWPFLWLSVLLSPFTTSSAPTIALSSWKGREVSLTFVSTFLTNTSAQVVERIASWRIFGEVQMKLIESLNKISR